MVICLCMSATCKTSGLGWDWDKIERQFTKPLPGLRVVLKVQIYCLVCLDFCFCIGVKLLSSCKVFAQFNTFLILKPTDWVSGPYFPKKPDLLSVVVGCLISLGVKITISDVLLR